MAAVSIITPVHNAEAFLGEAITSVQRQTFGDWEMLIVDDRSTDSSRSVAMEAASKDARIRVLLDPEHSGAGAARNCGLRAATGEFVAFLDADDLYEPEKLAFEMRVLARFPEAAMTYGPTCWFSQDERERSWTEKMRGFSGRLHRPPDLVRRVILDQESEVPCTCAVLIRRRAIEETGGFIEALSLYEDQTLWVKLMLRYPVFVHDQALCRYRQHGGSASAQAVATGEYDRYHPHPARVRFLEWLTAEASAANDTRLQRSVRIAFHALPGKVGALSAHDRLALAHMRVRKRARQLGRLVRRRFGIR